jgi:hypothetical protein
MAMRTLDMPNSDARRQRYAVRPQRTEPPLDRFPLAARDAVLELSQTSQRLADLVESFPALLVAIATEPTNEAAQTARHAVIDGAPLQRIAAILDIPLWLRHLPPDAFEDGVPRLPADPDFARDVLNYVPGTAGLVGPWLQRVTAAYDGAGAAFAQWTARHDVRLCVRDRTDGAARLDAIRWLAAWAWHSQQPHAPATAFLRLPWTSALGPKRACAEAQAWRDRIALYDVLTFGRLRRHHSDGIADGLTFKALTTVRDFVEGSEALDNCLDQYADRLRQHGTSVYLIYARGRPIAVVELGDHPADPRFAHIVRLLGRGNRPAPPDVWRAAYRWLATAGATRAIRRDPGPAPHKQSSLWDPYLASLPTGAPRAAFTCLAGIEPARNDKTRGRAARSGK